MPQTGRRRRATWTRAVSAFDRSPVVSPLNTVGSSHAAFTGVGVATTIATMKNNHSPASWIVRLGLAASLMSMASTAVLAQALDIARFRQLRTEGVAAANGGDLPTAAERLAQARAILPSHPGLIVLQARVAETAGQPDEAVAYLQAYADLGLSLSPATLSGFSGAATATDLNARLQQNAEPVGRPKPVSSTGDLILLEGLAWSGSRLLASSIRRHTIHAVGADGALLPWLQEEQALGVFGLAADLQRDRLWAALAGGPAADVAADVHAGRSELLEIELSSGRVLNRYSPPEAPNRNFGDVAVGPDGTVAVSDSFSGEVFLKHPGAGGLERLVPPGVLASPQGLVFHPDGRSLLVSDYGSGLHRIDLTTGEATPVRTPADVTLIGADALSLAPDGSVWTVQNGVSPNRIMRLTLSTHWAQVTEARVVVANLPDMDQPSGLTIRGDDLIFIRQSQWGRLSDDGEPLADTGQAAIIASLPLADR